MAIAIAIAIEISAGVTALAIHAGVVSGLTALAGALLKYALTVETGIEEDIPLAI